MFVGAGLLTDSFIKEMAAHLLYTSWLNDHIAETKQRPMIRMIYMRTLIVNPVILKLAFIKTIKKKQVCY